MMTDRGGTISRIVTKKRVLLGVVATVIVAIVSVFILCRAPDSRVVRLGFLPIAAGVSLFVAIEKKFFARAEIDVEPIQFASSERAIHAMLGGRTDGTIMIGYATPLALYAKNPGVFQIFQSSEGNPRCNTSCGSTGTR